MTGHLLAFEHLAGVLALTGRAMHTVRQRVTVGRAATAEMVALDDTLEPLTGRSAGDVDLLAGDEVVNRQLGTDIQEVVRRNAELGNLGLRLHGGGGEMTAHGLRRVLDLGKPDAELNSGIAVLFLRTLCDDLAALHAENGNGDMLAGIIVDAGHSHLLCNYT